MSTLDKSDVFRGKDTNCSRKTGRYLEQLISVPQPTTLESNTLIKAAKVIGEEQSRLISQERLLNEEFQIKQKRFQKQAPSTQALGTEKTCNKEIELTIPYGYLSFSTEYEANIKDEKEITVTQYLSITNRSGIDMEADTAMFYYRSANQYVYPTHFYPWIVSKYEPRPQRVSKRTMEKNARMDMEVMAEEKATVIFTCSLL